MNVVAIKVTDVGNAGWHHAIVQIKVVNCNSLYKSSQLE